MSSIALWMAYLLLIGVLHAAIVLIVHRRALGYSGGKYRLRSGLTPELVRRYRAAQRTLLWMSSCWLLYVIIAIESRGNTLFTFPVLTFFVGMPGIGVFIAWVLDYIQLYKVAHRARVSEPVPLVKVNASINELYDVNRAATIAVEERPQ